MIEGMDADTVQIVSENELKALKTYVEKNKLKVDMDSLENGTGVMIIHDHKLSQKQEKQAEKAVGETVCLSPLKNKEACIRWNSMTDKERDKEDEIIKAETPVSYTHLYMTVGYGLAAATIVQFLSVPFVGLFTNDGAVQLSLIHILRTIGLLGI